MESIIFEVLASFNKTEFSEFGRYLRSPYYNNRSEVVRLYDTLKAYHPKFSSKSLTKENLFIYIYPGKEYNDVLMRKVVSLTVNHAVNYLAVKGAEDNVLEFNIRALDKLREKKLNKLFEKKDKAIIKMFTSSRETFNTYEMRYKYTSIKNGYFLNKDEKEMVHHFQQELDEMVEYFLIVALLMYIRLSEWQVSYNVKFNLILREDVLKLAESGKYDSSPLVSLYYNMHMLLAGGEEKYYFELGRQREKFASRLSQIDDYNTTIVMIQYCYRRVQSGDIAFRTHQFNIVKEILEKGYIPPGFIEPYFFINSARNSAQVGEFAWCEDFIAEYSSRLNPDTSTDIRNYAYSVLEFFRGNFESALGYLSKINPERVSMKLDMKNKQMMIYYELGYWQELESYIDSYKHYLSRDKEASEKDRTRHSEFVKLVSNLMNYRENGDVESAEMLIKKLVESPYFNYKEWILEKAKLIK